VRFEEGRFPWTLGQGLLVQHETRKRQDYTMSQQYPPDGPPGYGAPQGSHSYQGYTPGPNLGYQPLQPKQPWYHSSVVVGVSLLFCLPLGLLLLWTSRTTSVVVKVLATAVFGGLGLLVMIGGAVGGNKSKSTETSVVAAATPEQVAVPAPQPPPPPPKSSVAYLRVSNGANLECLEIEAADPAALKLKLKLTGKGETLEEIRTEFAAAMKKKLGKANAEGTWSVLDTCPRESVLAACNSPSSTIVAYDVEVALSLKKECGGKDEQWQEAPTFAQAVASMPIKITAVDLQNAYEDNEVQADMRYKGRILRVTGNVESVSKDVLDKPFVALGTKNMFTSVVAYGMPESQVANLHKGDRITLTCKGSGMTMRSAVLRECGQ
jgi:hypothetical protein